MLIGKLCNIGEKEYDYFIEDKNFVNDKEELNDFAIWLNSPWSQTDESYLIKYNCKDSYTEKESKEPNWKCIYKVVGYEMITSEIYGYGNTQQESLQNCIDLFDRLQKEYNVEDESF